MFKIPTIKLMAAFICCLVFLLDSPGAYGQSNDTITLQIYKSHLTTDNPKTDCVIYKEMNSGSANTHKIRYIVYTKRPIVLLKHGSQRFQVLQGSDTVYNDGAGTKFGTPIVSNSYSCYESILLKYSKPSTSVPIKDLNFDIVDTDTIHITIRSKGDGGKLLFTFTLKNGATKEEVIGVPGNEKFNILLTDSYTEVKVKHEGSVFLKSYGSDADSIEVFDSIDNESPIELNELPSNSKILTIGYCTIDDLLTGKTSELHIAIEEPEPQWWLLFVIIAIVIAIATIYLIGRHLACNSSKENLGKEDNNGKEDKDDIKNKVKKEDKDGKKSCWKKLSKLFGDTCKSTSSSEQKHGENIDRDDSQTGNGDGVDKNPGGTSDDAESTNASPEEDQVVSEPGSSSVEKHDANNHLSSSLNESLSSLGISCETEDQLKHIIKELIEDKNKVKNLDNQLKDKEEIIGKHETTLKSILKVVNGLVSDNSLTANTANDIPTCLKNWQACQDNRNSKQEEELKNMHSRLDSVASGLMSKVDGLKGNQELFLGDWLNGLPKNSPLAEPLKIIEEAIKKLVKGYKDLVTNAEEKKNKVELCINQTANKVKQTTADIETAINKIHQALEDKGFSSTVVGTSESLIKDAEALATAINGIPSDIEEANKQISDLKVIIEKQKQEGADALQAKENTLNNAKKIAIEKLNKEHEKALRAKENSMNTAHKNEIEKLNKEHEKAQQVVREEFRTSIEKEKASTQNYLGKIIDTRDWFVFNQKALVDILTDDITTLQQNIESVSAVDIPMKGFFNNAMSGYKTFKKQFEQWKDKALSNNDIPLKNICEEMATLCRNSIKPLGWINLLETLKAYSDVPMLHDAMCSYGLTSARLTILDGHIRALLGAVGIQLIVPRLLLDHYDTNYFDYDNSGTLWINRIVPGISLDPKEFQGRIFDIRQMGFEGTNFHNKPKVFYY